MGLLCPTQEVARLPKGRSDMSSLPMRLAAALLAAVVVVGGGVGAEKAFPRRNPIVEAVVKTMHIGVIASMKKGLEHFIYREVCELARAGATISLFPTKHRHGLYNPRPDWRVYRWRLGHFA